MTLHCFMIEIYLQPTSSPKSRDEPQWRSNLGECLFYPLNPKIVYRRSLLIQPRKHVKYPKLFAPKCLNSPNIRGRYKSRTGSTQIDHLGSNEIFYVYPRWMIRVDPVRLLYLPQNKSEKCSSSANFGFWEIWSSTKRLLVIRDSWYVM